MPPRRRKLEAAGRAPYTPRAMGSRVGRGVAAPQAARLAAVVLAAWPLRARATAPAEGTGALAADLAAPSLVPLATPDHDDAPPAPLPRALRRPAALVAQGQGRRALGPLDHLPGTLAASREARFLRAEALYQARRWADAAEDLRGVLLASPLLADRVRYHLGAALHHLGRDAQASEVLAAVPESSRFHLDALLLQADVRLDLGQAKAVARALAPWRHTPDAPRADEVLFRLGRAESALGHRFRAVEAFRSAVLAQPGGPVAARAAGRLAVLDAHPHRHLAWAWSRLAAALTARHRAAALAHLAGSRRARPLLATVLFLRGRLAHRAGHDAEAMTRFAEAAQRATRAGDTDLAARATYAQAVAARDAGQDHAAARAFAAVAADHADHPLAPRALLAAATLEVRLRAFAEARRHLRAFLLLNPVDPRRPRALFLMGWVQLRLGHAERAAEFFATAAKEAPAKAARETERGAAPITAAARSLYWSARALSRAGHIAAAQAGYRAILSRYPLSYYAALSRAHLAGAEAVALLPTPPPSETRRPVGPRLLRARQAAHLGWVRAATLELTPFLAGRVRRVRGRDLLVAADLLAGLHRTAAARALYREAVMRHPGGLSPVERERAWHQAFPRYHVDVITRVAKRFHLSPWLLDGLVLRESGWRSCVRSGAAAYGLTQLILPTARDAAGDLRLPHPTRRRLCDPRYNLELGAWHLKKLLRHFHGSEVLALAAYNAGAGAVDRWLARWGDLPVDAFVEVIPFDETRSYVRTVLSAARAYAWIYGAPGTGGIDADLHLGLRRSPSGPLRTAVAKAP